MPTALDNMMKSKNMIWAFGLVVVAATAKVVWGTEMFPPEKDPIGDPNSWTREEMRRWLAAEFIPPGLRHERRLIGEGPGKYEEFKDLKRGFF